MSPKTLHLRKAHNLAIDLSYTRILPNLPSNLELTIFSSYVSFAGGLTFKNVYVKIMEVGCAEPMFLFGESVMLQLEIDTNNDMFQFTSRIEENSDKNAVFLHQNLNRLGNFKNFKTIVDPQELKELNKIFPNENILKFCKGELIIPMNKIIIVDIYMMEGCKKFWKANIKMN